MSRTDRRPYTPEDDAYIGVAVAEGVGYCAVATALSRSVRSVKGRADRLREEPVREALATSRLLADE